MSTRRPSTRARVNPASSSRANWMAARARNALRRPLFIGTVSALTFLAALIAMIIVPQQARKAAAAMRTTQARPDTEPTFNALQVALRQVGAAESEIVASRVAMGQLIAATAASVTADTNAAGDTLSRELRARRDTLTDQTAALGRLLARAENAPLLGSYRALAQAVPMQGDEGARQLLDSLVEIERERESYNAVGGVDPVFVALTARANELGRSIVGLAEVRRTAMRAELAALAPPAPALPQAIASRPLPDTMARIQARDTARIVAAEVAARLARERAELQRLDVREQRMRDLSAASPTAMLAAAIVFGAMLGFGVALFDEVRHPRIADAHEVELTTGVRVIGTITPLRPSPERGRRASDRSAPPYIDPGSDGHQLIYLTVATAGSSVVMLTITGDSAAVNAVVAINFAAIAADEARGTLLVDTDANTSAVSLALRLRPSAGLTGVLEGRTQWSAALRATRVGRDRAIEVVPSGHGSPALPDIVALLQRDVARLSKRYDAIVMVSSVDQVTGGLPMALPIPDVLYCARAGQTPIAQMKKELDDIQNTGAQLRGIVIWNANEPVLSEVRPEEQAKAEQDVEEPAATTSA